MKRVGSREVWRLPEVTAAVWRRFEDIPSLWVEAEVQELRERGGQIRFRLVDEHSIDASMNAIVFARLRVRPVDGELVQAYGRIEYHRRTSQVGMRVERVEPVGEGLLRAQIAALRSRLEGEGLLDPARKRPTPTLPRRVGLVTSGQGAARDDVLRNLWLRFPRADVLLVDVPVQGDQAAPAIVRALRALDATAEVDVIVVARGGGSLEDLMAFNSEPVCRAVAASGTPVVSAIGHEKDVTLCDLVADVRVSTPTAAAEAVVPDLEAVETHLADARRALAGAVRRAGRDAEVALRTYPPRLVRALREGGARAELVTGALERRLGAGVAATLARAPAELGTRARELERAGGIILQERAARLERAGELLGALSPRRTLARGYAIVHDGRTDAILSSAAAVARAGELSVELADGVVAARVSP